MAFNRPGVPNPNQRLAGPVRPRNPNPLKANQPRHDHHRQPEVADRRRLQTHPLLGLERGSPLRRPPLRPWNNHGDDPPRSQPSRRRGRRNRPTLRPSRTQQSGHRCTEAHQTPESD
uniref:(northern house mosquito) hypothetical protein n=1 Tax=Culex pipiens TaxID=7175 RepID=A0A8D7ZZF5_CULPI